MKLVSLVQVEVSGIQSYIFGSNHLSQNIGASELVARSTTQWVAEALDESEVKHNTVWRADLCRLELIEPEATDLQAKVIYAGGGNALLLFVEEEAHKEHAKRFTRSLTYRALREARELSLVVGQIEFDWESQTASSQHIKLRKLVARRKLNRMPSIPLSGLGVTAACTFTGLPAVAEDEEGRLLSQAVCHKLRAEQANQSLSHILRSVKERNFELERDFDFFGEKGESSYIAVVHTDGNSMGKRFEAIANAHPSPSDNQAYFKQLRALSQSVRDKATQALKKTADELLQSYDEQNKCFGKVVPAPEKDGKRSLPFRPLVFGGDDTTFVCEGRLGLTLAAKYLRELAQGDLPGAREGERGDPFYARAGIAIVNSHYPFSRAYQLAEELANSAKEKLPELTRRGKGIVMDWHFSTSGIGRTLSEIRQREYVATTGNSLLMRPLRLDLGAPPKGSRYWRSYANFERVITTLQEGEAWKNRRHKIKALRVSLREGAESVKLFRANYELPLLPSIPFQSQMAETGWNAENCGYFDAIEAIKFYEPLNKQEEAK